MLLLPFGGINVSAGSTAQATATTAAQLACWDETAGSNLPTSGTISGDPAVKGDYANNRILLNSPGIYQIMFHAQGTSDTATEQLTFQIRKNSVVQGNLRAVVNWTYNGPNNTVVIIGILQVLKSDIPGTIATMPAEASTTGPNNTPSFSGASGAPSTEVPVDVVVSTAASTPNLTIVDANLTAIRLQ
jgi:hypothetical protein